MESAYPILSVLFLMTVSVFAYVLARRINFPYTLFLVFIGVVLVPLSYTDLFSFLQTFKLTPELLFYVFLPTLLFEAAYNIKLNQLVKNIKPIASLAVVGLLISAFVTAILLDFALKLFEIQIPFMALLLFGAIISATDPVAVIAMFKEYGAPKRLALIFEGESLFNDGTAVALFLSVLYLIKEGERITLATMPQIGAKFTAMIILGFAIGVISGILFSKLLDFAKSRHLQVTLMLVSAHLTFLLSELISHHLQEYSNFLGISPIIATATAAVVLGNYGRYKLPHEVEEYVNNLWHYFAFLANSLVFLLLGLIIAGLNINYSEVIIPATLAIVSVIIARAISVYLPLSLTSNDIPKSWQHLLAWGSLRGALAVTMVLLIPNDISIANWPFETPFKNWMMAMVILSIFFSLFVKGLTIPKMMKAFALVGKLTVIEKLEYLLAKIYAYSNVLSELKYLRNFEFIQNEDYKSRIKKYKTELQKTALKLANEANKHKNKFLTILHYFAVGIEEELLKELYAKGEVTEKGYKKFLQKLDAQKIELQQEKGSVSSFDNIFYSDLIEKILHFGKSNATLSLNDKYLYYRALFLSAKKVQDALSNIKKTLPEDEFIYKSIETLNKHYKKFAQKSFEKLQKLLNENEKLLVVYQDATENELKDNIRNTILKLKKQHLITGKVTQSLLGEFKCEKE